MRVEFVHKIPVYSIIGCPFLLFISSETGDWREISKTAELINPEVSEMISGEMNVIYSGRCSRK